MNTETLLLTRSQVNALLDLPECIAAMEQAFRQRAEGQAFPPALMHLDAEDGEFHIKGGGLRLAQPYVALKANGGFFHNRQNYDLPNILGLILLFDGRNGRPLAVMDSIAITILRTGATTALAARYLARPDSAIVTICGCGNQGRVQLRALQHVLPNLRQAYAWDADPAIARQFADQLSDELRLEIHPVSELAPAARQSDVIVTCTPARQYFLRQEDVRPGTFIAAVGADSPGKQEVQPELLAASTVVVDILEQCVRVGELQHALRLGLMTAGQVHAELGDLVSGRRPGRTHDREITLFDTTGSAIQDTAAAAAVYEKARAAGLGAWLDLFA